MPKGKGSMIVLIGVGGKKKSHKMGDAFDDSPKGLFGGEEDEKIGSGESGVMPEKPPTGTEDLIRAAADIGVNGIKEWPEAKRTALLAAVAEKCNKMKYGEDEETEDEDEKDGD
jgi:hypothetical protein